MSINPLSEIIKRVNVYTILYDFIYPGTAQPAQIKENHRYNLI